MKANKIIVQLKNGNALIRDFELTMDDAELIKEAITFYFINADVIEKEMLEKGSYRLRCQAFYLKNDLKDILEKLK